MGLGGMDHFVITPYLLDFEASIDDGDEYAILS